MSFLHLAMSRIFEGKACYNDTLVLGDWVLAEKQSCQELVQFCSGLYFVFSCTS